MLHSCTGTYDCMHTLFDYLKSSLNVQNLVPVHQILAFFAQIAYLAQNKYSHLASAGYTYCQHAIRARTNSRSEETGSFTTSVAL
jgi:hypothetical protein